MEELELTYLPKYLPPEILDSPSKDILDIYIPKTSHHPTLRIRRAGNKCEITKKQPIVKSDASHQLETTIPLTREEFADLAKIPGKRIVKVRFFLKEKGIYYQIDVFQEKLKGLVLVDIEFNSLIKKEKFIPPKWLLANVTQEEFIAGGMLCGKSYGDIEEKLKALGYHRLKL